MKTAKQRRLPKLAAGTRTRRYYIFDAKAVNKDECVVQGRRTINSGDYDQVEVHMHGTDVECPGVFVMDDGKKCFRFGKGIQ